MNRALFAAACLLAACATANKSRPGPFSKRELAAVLHYDLGPERIDVSRYPQEHRENYKLFQRVCSQCHSLARPINAPVLTHAGWKYYIFRMRLSSLLRKGSVSKQDAQKILEFLSYDSTARKLGNQEFEERDRARRLRYRKILFEKIRRLQKSAPLRH